MNKQQFLDELHNCLEGEVSQQIIYDNISYYRQYFEEQVSQGRSETEVAEELGKPAWIAKTIIDSSDVSDNRYYEEQIFTEEGENAESDGNVHTIEIKWYHKLLIAALIILFFILLFTVAGVVITYAGPILLILCIVYLLRRLF